MTAGARAARTSWFGIGLLALAVLKLWLTRAQPLQAIGPAGHDDRLYLRLAELLLKGEWLGPYDQFTLAKGPFYPMWVAAVARLGLPLMAAQHVLYAASCLAVVLALRPLCPRRGVLAGLYTALLFNPMTVTNDVLRAVREGIYPALTLLVIAGAAGLYLRRVAPLRHVLAWSLGTGLALAAFWLTREEGLWLLPAVLPLLAAAAWSALRSGERVRVACVTAVLAAWGLPLLLVCLWNGRTYGVFATVEFKHRDFLAAYGALMRVEPKAWDPSVLMARETRARIYAESPVFAGIRPALERQCDEHWGDPAHGREVRGGWFMWALRDGVCDAGLCRTGAQAMDYYARLARDVDRACVEGRLACGPSRASMAPRWRREYVEPVLRTVVSAVRYTTTFRWFSAETPATQGPAFLLPLFREMTGERLAPLDTEHRLVRGWAVSRAGLPVSLSVRDAARVPVDAGVTWSGGPLASVPQPFRDAAAQHPSYFLLETPCTADCTLELADGRATGTVSLAEGPQRGKHLGLYWNVESVTTDAAEAAQRAALDRPRVEILSVIGQLYSVAVPALCVVSAVAFAATLGRRAWRPRARPFLLIEIGLAAAILLRIGLISVIHVTSFSAVGPQYLAPVYPLLLLLLGTTTLGRLCVPDARP